MIRGALSGLLVGALRRRGAAFGPGSGVGGGPSTSLDLNFIAMAASGVLDPRITFSRGSLATLTDSAGNVAYAPHNLLTYSQAMANVNWVKYNATVTGNAAIAPDGTMTACHLAEDSSTNQHFIDIPALTTGDSVYSFYAKAGARTFAYAYVGTTSAGIFFNLSNGTTGSNYIAAPAASIITSVGNGWYRCSIRVTAGTGSPRIGVSIIDGSSSYAGDGTSGIYIWGAQLNVGPLQPYYPTTSAAYHGPRFTYDPITHAPLGLLIEEQRTNLALYSGGIGGTGWTTSGALTVTANAVAGPTGGTTATRIQTTGSASVYQNVTVAASTAYTFTLYAKNNSGTKAEYSVYDVTHATNIYAETSYLSSINGSTWTRVTVAFTTPAGCVSVNIYPIRATGSGVDLYLDCAQLEAGAFATSYIPTTSATVTRAADSATMTASRVSAAIHRSMRTAWITTCAGRGAARNALQSCGTRVTGRPAMRARWG